jgi:hypothetical protein
MGLFNFWKKKKDTGDALLLGQAAPEAGAATVISASTQQPQDNIHILFSYLSRDFQQQGYDDALVNADASYMQQNMDAIQGDLQLIIRRVKVYYADAVKQLEFLIETRGRMGMIDVVDELKMKLDKAKSHQQEVMQLEKEIQEGLGAAQRIMISYKRGFTSGLAALANRKMNDLNF